MQLRGAGRRPGAVRADVAAVAPQGPPPDVDADEALAQTRTSGLTGYRRCSYQGKYRDAVVRSLITIKALTYEPTGGIVAAPTTSLPEDIGGVRNWDYRYCWLRDATIVLEALLRTGYIGRSRGLAATGWAARLPGPPPTCRSCTASRASGGCRSGPRTGCPGTRTRPRSGSATTRSTRFSSTSTARSWTRSCSGARPGCSFDKHLGQPCRPAARLPRAALDRAGRRNLGGARRPAALRPFQGDGLGRVRPPDQDGRNGPVVHAESTLKRWRSIRDRSTLRCASRVRRQPGNVHPVLRQYLLDAAVLMLAETGFLPPDDARIISTVHMIRRELTHDGLVLRYSQPETRHLALRSTACQAPRARSWPAASGWSTRCT